MSSNGAANPSASGSRSQPEPSHPKLLVIDSYDSFTNNLVALVKHSIPSADLYIIRNDQIDEDQLIQHLSLFSAIIIGPGPGSPLNARDVGVIRSLWHLSQGLLLPIFGVCLGLQSLGVEFEATLRRLNVVKHGMVAKIRHNGDPLFDDIVDGVVVRYHSLHVTLSTPAAADALEPLAWADDPRENGEVIMALKHKTKPFWSVQYHPESILTDGSGLTLIKNFWALAQQWNEAQRKHLLEAWNPEATKLFGFPWPNLPSPPSRSCIPSLQDRTVTTVTLPLLQLPVAKICEALGVTEMTNDFVLLDSAAQPGRFSIIGCLHPNSPRISYTIGDEVVSIQTKQNLAKEPLNSTDIWSWISTYMHSRRATGGNPDIPFWGGLVGTLSYELGVHSINCPLLHRPDRPKHLPDVNLVFVERSLVIDWKTNRIHLQSIIPDDQNWFSSTELSITRIPTKKRPDMTRKVLRYRGNDGPSVVIPDKDGYLYSIKVAMENLLIGQSYELCLTSRTKVLVPHSIRPRNFSWNLYTRLRTVNPAPYAAYLRLHPITLLSSSPERFLSFSRPPNQRCQLRPIKGTVRKASFLSKEQAEAILHSSKEVAENLMIVDLIRHDLHGVVGPSVEVKQFCGIEEYETVWQSVSAVEGVAMQEKENGETSEIGWEALRRSLPPGSMTGAPKKRSVDILQVLEDEERGMYSGVFGYWCVGGSGDWAIAIRSCYKIEEEIPATSNAVSRGAPAAADGNVGGKTDEWIIGAGGAITALSDPEAEWEEMMVKLESVLRAFRTNG